MFFVPCFSVLGMDKEFHIRNYFDSDYISILQLVINIEVTEVVPVKLREKCPHREFFSSAFAHIRTK